MPDLHDDIVQFLKAAIAAKGTEAQTLGRRLLHQVAKQRPDLRADAEALLSQLNGSALRALRQAPNPPTPAIPVDLDSRRELLRRYSPGDRKLPTWPREVQTELDRIVRQHERAAELVSAGLAPSRSVLFVGPPGVGKTLAAHAVASRVGRELLVLDLASVMSSLLGRTGNNIRTVLEYASRSGSALLLDEFDAIAKRRDDPTDVGELRRLVNVLLQSIDDWPPDGLLFAATNHPDLLDPAVWRRFDKVVSFPQPDDDALRAAVTHLVDDASEHMLATIVLLLRGSSYAEVERHISAARRDALLDGLDLISALTPHLHTRLQSLSKKDRIAAATVLFESGQSQRMVHELTGVSRDTIRRHVRSKGGQDGPQG